MSGRYTRYSGTSRSDSRVHRRVGYTYEMIVAYVRWKKEIYKTSLRLSLSLSFFPKRGEVSPLTTDSSLREKYFAIDMNAPRVISEAVLCTHAQWPMNDRYRRYDRHREDMHINNQTGVPLLCKHHGSCLARYLDAADHIVTSGASLDRKSMDGDDSGFYILSRWTRARARAMKNDRDQMARGF